jgi:sec-independent protein translocase protein TatA
MKMGAMSIWHWVIVLVVVLLMFGAGKLPTVMGDMAKGVKAFRKGLKDENAEPPPPPPAVPPAADKQP